MYVSKTAGQKPETPDIRDRFGMFPVVSPYTSSSVTRLVKLPVSYTLTFYLWISICFSWS